MGKQMTSSKEMVHSSTEQETNWRSIDWKKARREVRRLQMRIAKAVKEGRYGKVNALQWTLTHSFYARALAVKRVTSNKGKKTPGVDGVLWKSAKDKMQAVHSLRQRGYKAQPLRRIYIPKKNGKKRPLSIPAMYDRAMQALYKLALAPVAETIADRNSYGFREGRSCADAVQAAFNALAKPNSATWVLEGDITGCFDNISMDWLMQNIPLEKRILRQWLEAGYVEKGFHFPTRKRTPQGGIISPTLANMTLDGLEQAIHAAVPRRVRVNFIRYADDFIITGKSKNASRGKCYAGGGTVPNSAWAPTLGRENEDHLYPARIYVPRPKFSQARQHIAYHTGQAGSSRPDSKSRNADPTIYQRTDDYSHQKAQRSFTRLGKLPQACGGIGRVWTC